jgi:hypothetical protein
MPLLVVSSILSMQREQSIIFFTYNAELKAANGAQRNCRPFLSAVLVANFMLATFV